MKKKLYLIGLIAITFIVTTITCIKTFCVSDPFLDANIDALAGTETGLSGNCRNEINDCMFICSCGEIYISSLTRKGPSYNISGTCVSCLKQL